MVGGWKLSENKIPLLSQEGKLSRRRSGVVPEPQRFAIWNHPSYDFDFVSIVLPSPWAEGWEIARFLQRQL